MPAKGRTVAQSKLIAGLVGPLLVAIGIAMLINRHVFPAMIGEIAHNYGLVFLSGILIFLAGVAIVRVHNVWTGGWRMVITAMGWIAIASGIVRMWFPQRAAPIAEALGSNATGLLFGGHRRLGPGGLPLFQSLSVGNLR
jgi:hypothetical protein